MVAQRSATRSSPSARSVVEDEPRPKVDLVDKHHNCDKDFEEHSDRDCDLGPRRLRKRERKKSVADNPTLLNFAIKGPWHVK